MPAIPMNEAADRYSPEIAEAFQPTETVRPATKKSLAVLDCLADQKPMPTVRATVMSEKDMIHGSTPSRNPRKLGRSPERVAIMTDLPAGQQRLQPARARWSAE